ncbi:hypothetical protein PybrP1_004771 [[Pythium] brassicae (nom. inval.)]|nr:hypothetical protein PybrP1_004771 [[Pythium] brassicae (nom. inval.)]
MADDRNKREADGAAPPAKKKRKLRKGVKKSKAERLARRAAETASTEALAALAALLEAPTSDSSAAWDAAQLQAQRLDSPAAKELVVRTVLWAKAAPRAAAHYARRLELPEADVLRVLGSRACADGASSLLAAKFLSELSAAAVSNTQRLELFLWPWLLAQAKEKCAAADSALSGAKDAAAGDSNDNVDSKGSTVATPHAAQAYGAAIRLLLLSPPAPAGATTKQKQQSEREELQRLLVAKCLATGEFLHLVPAFASAFRERVDRAKQSAADQRDAESYATRPNAVVQAEQTRRRGVAERIEHVLRLMWPDARVVVFGSSATGLLSIESSGDGGGPERCDDDLDLCVLLPSSPVFRHDTGGLVVEMKEHLSVYLPACQELLAIEGARIPIVQFTDATSGVRCDVCVNNVPALWNTQLVALSLDGGARTAPVRSLSLWLKRWRRAKRKLFGKGLSSYGLQLLVLYYFQQRRVLATFRVADESVETEDALKRFSWEAVREAVAAVQVEPARPEPRVGSGAPPPTTFWGVLVDFFRFYALEFDFEESVVCLRRSEVVSKASKGWTRRAWKAALSIEDPIECDRDLGTRFTRKSLGKLRTALVHGCAILSEESESREEKERKLLAVMPYDLERAELVYQQHLPIDHSTMAIPGGSEDQQVPSQASPPLKRSSSAAAQDRKLKLQRFLVMKAFNLRREKQTVSQQFQFLKQQPADQSGRPFIDLGKLCEYLAIAPFRRLVLCQVFELPESAQRLDFDLFVRFLQTGAVQAAEAEKALQRSSSARSLPESPPTATPRAKQLGERDGQLVCFQPSWLSSQTRFSRPPPAPGLWKKREITIQERITEYTKIDELGRPQHLIEKEKHQTEVIHMETLEGEFAHREITQFEQTEQLNDEIVHHEHGREEFVHLKSEHDEVSRFESSIPTSSGPARTEECEQPPPSPTIKRDPSVANSGSSPVKSPRGDDDGDDELQGDRTPPQTVGMTDDEFCQYQREMAAERDEYTQQHFDF